VTAVNDETRFMLKLFSFFLFFRSSMPTDTNENSIALTTMTTVADSNNNESSTNHIPSPPLSSSLQTSTTTRANSPVQTPSKQLDKLRRFLSTLYYFGSDISNEIGERVRTLILALVVSSPMRIKAYED
jgi:hypothetical protein